MKVLEINATYGHGSTGTIVYELEQLCLQNGIDCYIASRDRAVKNAKNGYFIGNIIDHKLHALLCRINGRQAYFSQLPTLCLLKHIAKIKPDVIHLHDLHSNYINLRMLLSYLAKHDIRTIITLHDCWYFAGGCFHYTAIGCDKWQHSCGNCPKKRQDTPAYFKDCSASILRDRKRYLTAIPRLTIIGASQWVADQCHKSVLKSCDIRFIHNGFNLDIFRPTSSDLRKKLRLEGKYVILAPASKWYLSVNQSTLQYFVNNLKPDMVLLLFGCSVLHENLPANVKEIGFIKNPEQLASLYSMADILVNCTREDTFTSINMECQACGTPVATYDSTGCKETVDNISGKYVTTGDYEALFQAMLEIRAIGKDNLQSKCVERVKLDFEKNTQFMKYIELFKENING